MKKKFILPIVTLVLTLFGLGSCQFITHDHNYGDTWSHDDTHHWKVCTVEGCGRVSFKDEHVGGTATETEKAKCSVCGESYGSLKGHTHANTVSKVDEAYLKDPATCESKAVNYKSCECGEKGNETFEHGEPLGHDYTNASWHYDENQHWQVCVRDNCEVTSNKVNHSGGTATELEKAICEVCSQPYGNLLNHVTHTYDQEVKLDKYIASAATCEDDATYYVSCICGEKGSTTFVDVDSKLGHDFASSWSSNETHHYHECERDNCDEIDELVEHFGGTATETEKAVCEGCGKPYGEYLEHSHVFDQEVVATIYLNQPATCTAPATYFVSCLCGEKGSESFEYGQALGHDETIKFDGQDHWYECSRENCDYESMKENHSGGTATELERPICEECGQVYGELLDHVYTYVPTVEATCGVEGVLEHYTCSGCDNLFRIVESIYVVVDESDLVIEPLEHNLVYVNDELEGHHQECDRENCDYSTDVVPHEEKDPACGEEVKCVCGYVLHEAGVGEHELTYDYINGLNVCNICDQEVRLENSASWYISGAMNGWDQGYSLYRHPNDDNIRVRAFDLEVGTYPFKVLHKEGDNNLTWYGNKGTMVDGAHGWDFSKDVSADCQITINVPGTYLFELDYNTLKVSVYQIDETASFGVIGSMNSWVDDVDMTYVGNNVWEAILHLDGATAYEYKVRVNDAWVVSFGKDYLAETNLSYTTTVAGDYLFVFNVNTREITVSLVEHVYGEEIEGTAATCTENGSLAYYTCSHCDAKFIKVENGYQRVTDQELVIEALGHDEKIIFDENYHWVECGRNECDYKSEVEEHKDGEATCTTLAICSVCEQEYGKALGHEMVIVYDKDYHWTKCSRECGEVTEKVEHDGGTATETERAVCTTCSQPYGDLLNHEHNYVKGNVTQPTCEDEGYTTYACACGESYNDDIVPATGHNYQSVVTNPTCEDKGYTTHTCSACDDTYTDNETNALGHTYVYQGIDTTNKKANYTCSRCSLTDARDKVTVYLVPNTNWKSDNARFAVYYWNSSGNTWVSMVKVNDNLYKADIEVAKCTTGIIFCRMNPNTSSNSWSNKWNQTADLSLTGTSNAYTVKAGTWDSGGGTWSTKND